MNASRIVFLVELALFAVPVTLVFALLAFYFVVFVPYLAVSGGAEAMGLATFAAFGLVLLVGGAALFSFWRIPISFIKAGRGGLQRIPAAWFVPPVIGSVWAVVALVTLVLTYDLSSDPLRWAPVWLTGPYGLPVVIPAVHLFIEAWRARIDGAR
jgi:hypothetical protein